MLISMSYSIDLNWNGYGDTSIITDTLDSATIYYGGFLPMSRYENLKITVKCNDTAEAGFKNDSVNFEWGFQTGTFSKDSAGKRDTIFAKEDRFIVDTMCADSFGVGTAGSINSSGTLTRSWNQASDTSQIIGYAIQRRQFSPEWDVLIRPWAKSLGGLNKDGAPLKLIFQFDQRTAKPVKLQ